MGTILGKCRLCLAENSELQDSHILPKWAYKRARGDDRDPVLVSGDSAIITSRQTTEHLLCWDCEQLISKAEKCVAELVYQEDGSTPLLGYLHTPEPSMHPAILEPRGVDLRAVARCVLSIFWRAHVSRSAWAPSLAPYERLLREHILCGVPLPTSIALALTFQTGLIEGSAPVGQIITMPRAGQRAGCHAYNFALCGLFPVLVTGPIPRSIRQLCVMHSQAKRIVVQPADDTPFVRFLGERLRAVQPRGKAMRALVNSARDQR